MVGGCAWQSPASVQTRDVGQLLRGPHTTALTRVLLKPKSLPCSWGRREPARPARHKLFSLGCTRHPEQLPPAVPLVSPLYWNAACSSQASSHMTATPASVHPVPFLLPAPLSTMSFFSLVLPTRLGFLYI